MRRTQSKRVRKLAVALRGKDWKWAARWLRRHGVENVSSMPVKATTTLYATIYRALWPKATEGRRRDKPKSERSKG